MANILRKTYDLYADGFRNMTVGRVLWAIILIKLAIIFLILKLFFFPDAIKQKAGNNKSDKAEYVASELIGR